MSDPQPDRDGFRCSVREAATLACLLEASAPKVGNVHRGADFEDLCLTDFLISGALLGEAAAEVSAELNPDSMGIPEKPRIGAAVRKAVERTRASLQTNTNLGIALLLMPLAASAIPLAEQIESVLSSMDAADAADVYAAIRAAQPGGLGEAESHDVNRVEAPPSLQEAMRLAADRDLIAKQYVHAFVDVFQAADWIEAAVGDGEPIESAIVIAHLRLLAELGDSLIARKLGPDASREVAARASRVVDLQSESPDQFWDAVGDLDFFLRSDGHRRNPGATADLIAAALFVLLREGRLPQPLRTSSRRGL